MLADQGNAHNVRLKVSSRDSLPSLTLRERAVLKGVVAGLANKTIAEDIGVGVQSVKAHVSRLFLKFRVENRAGLAVAAMCQELGLPDARDLERRALEQHRVPMRTQPRLIATLVGKDPAIVVGRDARVLLANPAFQRTFVAAIYKDERGDSLQADATPLARAARGKPASLRFELASGPRKGSWWHATTEIVDFDGRGGGVVVVFRTVRRPGRLRHGRPRGAIAT